MLTAFAISAAPPPARELPHPSKNQRIFSSLTEFVTPAAPLGIGPDAIAPTVISYIITEFPPKSIAKGFSLYMFREIFSIIK